MHSIKLIIGRVDRSIFATPFLFRMHSAEHRNLIHSLMNTLGRPFLENNEQVKLELCKLIRL